MSGAGRKSRRRASGNGTKGDADAGGCEAGADGSDSLDELGVLRSCASRLWQRILVDPDAINDLKLVGALVHIVRAIATVKRVRLLENGKDEGIGQQIREAAAGLDPYEDL